MAIPAPRPAVPVCVPRKVLVIQTAFLGDVVLGLVVPQALRACSAKAPEVHYLVRKGNESLLENHPDVQRAWVWDKQNGKLKNLARLARRLLEEKFDAVINLHRFAASGLLAFATSAPLIVGFDKNPMRKLYTQAFAHKLGAPGRHGHLHEVERNLSLLAGHFVHQDVLDSALAEEGPNPVWRPRLYPSEADFRHVWPYTQATRYYVMAPASVWFTKQWPPEQWRATAALLAQSGHVYLVGAPADKPLCASIALGVANCTVLAGELTFLQSAALMKHAKRVFANDSAPLHFATAMNAPTTGVFCSTVPDFGFGPLAQAASTVGPVPDLPCRPCGLHGHAQCPMGHFMCAWRISPSAVAASAC